MPKVTWWARKRQPEQGRRHQALVPSCVLLRQAVAWPAETTVRQTLLLTPREGHKEGTDRLTEEAPPSTFERPGKYPSSEFQGPKVSHFRGNKPSFPSPSDRQTACPSLSHPPPCESLTCKESFQTALGLFGLGPCGQSGCSG